MTLLEQYIDCMRKGDECALADLFPSRFLLDTGGRGHPAPVGEDGGGDDVPPQIRVQRRSLPHQRGEIYGGECGLVFYRVPRKSGAGGSISLLGDRGRED